MDPRERNQVGLELIQINVQGSIKSEGSRDGRDDLGDETIEVSEAGVSNVQVLLADIVDSFVIDLDSSRK